MFCLKKPGAHGIFPPSPTPRSSDIVDLRQAEPAVLLGHLHAERADALEPVDDRLGDARVALDDEDRKSTRLNSSHANISYAVFCLKKKKPISRRRSRSW